MRKENDREIFKLYREFINKKKRKKKTYYKK